MTMRNFLSVKTIFIILSFCLLTIATRSQNLPEIAGDGTLRRIHVPILMYHYVSPLPANADNIRVGLTLDPVIFRQHIQYLHDEGYHTISLYEMNEALENGAVLPPKPVILTFDDGYIDHYVHVFPVLQEFGFTGTFFIATAFIDNNLNGYMNWGQISEMASAGMNMEAHTKNHIDLRNRGYDLLIYEIMGSIESLEAHTGIASRMFAYPVGRYDEDTLAVLTSTPTLRAVTTQTGTSHTTDNYLELARMRITNETGVNGLIYLLNYRQQ